MTTKKVTPGEAKQMLSNAAEAATKLAQEIDRLQDIEARLSEQLDKTQESVKKIGRVTSMSSCTGDAFNALNEHARKLKAEAKDLAYFLGVPNPYEEPRR